jgi:nitroreductase
MSLVKRGLSVYRQRGWTAFLKQTTKFIQAKIPLIKNPESKGYPKEISKIGELSDDEILGIIRHEAHRIEKAVYNDIIEEKRSYYQSKKKRVENCIQVLEQRGYPTDNPTLSWAEDIIKMGGSNKEFVENNRIQPPDKDLSKLDSYINFISTRRSTRVWKDDQPDDGTWIEIGEKMIEAATWAPHSGNRQSWKFLLMTEDSEREPLGVIKEEHTMAAPLLIFVGMDGRLYGDVADSETGVYIDAGAAAMQMINVAHHAGVGTCWNHFGRDLIDSREQNKQAYTKFREIHDIPPYIEPIAIVAVGMPEYIPPTPPRPQLNNLLLDQEYKK